MNNFEQPPQSPKYNSEQLAEYLHDTDGALSTITTVLLRGYEESPEVYKPWPKEKVQESLKSILDLFEAKVAYYQGAGELEKAQEARIKVEELKNIFASTDDVEEIPEAFLRRVQQAVETETA